MAGTDIRRQRVRALVGNESYVGNRRALVGNESHIGSSMTGSCEYVWWYALSVRLTLSMRHQVSQICE